MGPASPLTQTGMILGTPVYMAPELLRSARTSSTASDIYSFGVLAFELIHAKRPFTEAQAAARAFGHFEADGTPMEILGVPAPLAAGLMSALSIDPLGRPTAEALVRMFEDALASTPPMAQVSGAAAVPTG